jgi:hypothetical protein
MLLNRESRHSTRIVVYLTSKLFYLLGIPMENGEREEAFSQDGATEPVTRHALYRHWLGDFKFREARDPLLPKAHASTGILARHS